MDFRGLPNEKMWYMMRTVIYFLAATVFCQAEEIFFLFVESTCV